MIKREIQRASVCLLLIAAALLSTSCGRDESGDCPVFSEDTGYLFMRRAADNPYDVYDRMPDAGKKMKINNIGGSLGKVFNDINDLHLEAAEKIGFDEIVTAEDAWKNTRGVVLLESDRYLCIDSLTHSLPYLTEQAAFALQEIGTAFADSIASRGGGNYRLIVTSVLRTPETVRSLRRRNRNATEHSAHIHGTTFDISYRRFAYDGGEPVRTQEDLKNLLGEVLHDQRENGRIYVKYERKQGCFHITAR